jgi:hypothetical protein
VTRTHAPRVLHVPNEPGAFRQLGYRAALKSLAESGTVGEVRSYSLLREVLAGRGTRAHEELLCLIKEMQPDAIFLQHVDGMRLTEQRLGRIRRAAPHAVIIFHEGDAYGRGKPLPGDAIRVAAAADYVFTVGAGSFKERFERDCQRVDYVPHGWDQVRFPDPEGPLADELDLVMIGNRVTSRAPWRRMPGALDRERLGAHLERGIDRLRTAIYGRGWKGAAARGWLNYDDQLRLLQRARVSVNWDYFPEEPSYFSDRLPISLVAGRPHVTTRHPGYEWLPASKSGLYLADSPDEGFEIALALLRRDPEQLMTEAAAGRAWAERYLSQRNVTTFMLWRAGLIDDKAERFPWH